MPVKDKVKNYIDAYFKNNPVPLKVDEQLYNDIQEEIEKEDIKLMRIRPFPDNEGMQASEELFQALHEIRTKFVFFNSSERLAFEMWFNEGTIQFFIAVVSEEQEERVRRQIDAHYPNADIVEETDVFPPVYDDDWIAGTELYLKQSSYYPIKNPKGVREMQIDPYRAITSDMVSRDTDRLVIQFTLKPAMGTWTHGGKLGYINPLREDIYEVAEGLKDEQKIPDGTTRDFRNPTSEERQLSEKIARQDGQAAFHVNARIFILSNDKGTAKRKINSIGHTFEQEYTEAGDQAFVSRPANGTELKRMLKEAVRRNVFDHEVILTIPELASAAHIPNQTIETPGVDWNQTQATARIPAEAERFGEDDGHGELLTGEKQQPEQATPTVDNAEEQEQFQPEDNIDDDPPIPTPDDNETPEGEEPDPWADDELEEPSPSPEPEPQENTPQQPPQPEDNNPPNNQQPQQGTSPSNTPYPDNTPQQGTPQQPQQNSNHQQPNNQQPQKQPEQNNPPNNQQPRQNEPYPDGGGQGTPQQPQQPQPQQTPPTNNDRTAFESKSQDNNEPDQSGDGIGSKIKRLIGFESNRGFQDEEDEETTHQPPAEKTENNDGHTLQSRDDNKQDRQTQSAGGMSHKNKRGGNQNTQKEGYPDMGSSSGTPRSKQRRENQEQQPQPPNDPSEPQYGSDEREKTYEENMEEPTVDDVYEEMEEEFEDEIEDWKFDPEKEPEDT